MASSAIAFMQFTHARSLRYGEIPRGFPDRVIHVSMVKMATQVKKSVCLERLEQILPAAYSNYQLLVPALDLMIHYRIDTVRQLNCVAKELDKRHHSGNIAKLVGSAAGIAGSTAAFAGAALTPFMGLGLVVTLAGLPSRASEPLPRSELTWRKR